MRQTTRRAAAGLVVAGLLTTIAGPTLAQDDAWPQSGTLNDGENRTYTPHRLML